MIYQKIHIDYSCRDYEKIIRDIDSALSLLHTSLVDDVFDNNKTGYKLNTGQSDVSVTINSSVDAIYNIQRLEKLREMYLQLRLKNRFGRTVRLRDQNNFR